MTISHQLAGVGPATALTNVKSTLASRLGRVAPLNREYLSSGTLQPYAVPWTDTTDTNGVSYPAGLVGVVGAYSIGAGPGSYEDLIDTYFANHSVPVPGVLPGAYTARLQRDCFFSDTIVGQARVDPSNTKYRDANGPISNLWVPVDASTARGTVDTSLGDTVRLLTLGPGYPGDPNDFWTTYKIQTACTGWRRLKYVYTFDTSYDEPDAIWSGNVTLTISHNANGSDPGGDNGDTIDHTQTFAYGDFTRTDLGAGHPTDRYVYTSVEIDAGAILPTVGTLSIFRFKLQHGTPTGPDAGGGQAQAGKHPFSIKKSPNLSVPFPFTATGDDDLIAPGGIL
jgi:hypothetical protein